MAQLFIAFDGLDGSGLSTQSSLLEAHLKKKYNVLLTKEPTNGLIGGLVKAILKSEWKADQKTLQLLFSADRAYHLFSEIIPALKEGRVVITDRYILSTLAFGTIDGVELPWLRSINSNFLKPDLTIILDVPVDVAINRIREARFGSELFEEEYKLSKVRENYHNLKNEFENTFLIDGNRPIEKVSEEIKKITEKALKKHRLQTLLKKFGP